MDLSVQFARRSIGLTWEIKCALVFAYWDGSCIAFEQQIYSAIGNLSHRDIQFLHTIAYLPFLFQVDANLYFLESSDRQALKAKAKQARG